MQFCCACRLTGKLPDGTVFADHQTDDNLLELIVGEGELCNVSMSLLLGNVMSNAAGTVLWI